MKILVTGGAGYIGSLVVEELLAQQHTVVVIDNLKHGDRNAVASGATLFETDLSDTNTLEEIFRRYSIEAVMHLAAVTSVEESMTNPTEYFRNNMTCGLILLEKMMEHGVSKLVFTSSAAVYGRPEDIPVTESTPAVPMNPYGESKYMFERVLQWYSRAYGLRAVSLRCFNVGGAGNGLGMDVNRDTSLIPIVLKTAMGRREYVPVFGTDHDTPDGTCIRDYVHVLDVVRAQISALNYLDKCVGSKVYNIGTGNGYSVTEVIETARQVTGTDIRVKVFRGRPGDPDKVVTRYELAEKDLGWKPEHSALSSIFESAWQKQDSHALRI